MTRQSLLDAARSQLERRPRDLTVDCERALDALRAEWHEHYDIGIDGNGWWWALRLDGLPGVRGDDPGELCAAIRADYGARPVSP